MRLIALAAVSALLAGCSNPARIILPTPYRDIGRQCVSYGNPVNTSAGAVLPCNVWSGK